MKKILLLIAVAAVAIGATSCNSSSRSWQSDLYSSMEFDYASFKNYVRRSDGVKLIPVIGKLPEFQDGLSRQRMWFGYYYIDDIDTPNEKNELQVEVDFYALSMTQLARRQGWAPDYDDPIVNIVPLWVPEWENSMLSYVGKPELQSQCVSNYLDFSMVFLAYKKNAESGKEFAFPDFEVEFDTETIPGEEHDTIRMVLKFDNKRHEEEKVKDGAWGHYPVSIDLEPLLSYFSNDGEDDEDLTYVLKLEYQAYDRPNEYSPYEVDPDKVKDLFVTTKWTPGKPYVE